VARPRNRTSKARLCIAFARNGKERRYRPRDDRPQKEKADASRRVGEAARTGRLRRVPQIFVTRNGRQFCRQLFPRAYFGLKQTS